MNDPRWTWWDNLEGGPGEDEVLVEPLRTVMYTWSAARSDGTSPSPPSPVAVKAAGEHWDRKLGRQGLSDTSRAIIVGAVSIAIFAANFWPKH